MQNYKNIQNYNLQYFSNILDNNENSFEDSVSSSSELIEDFSDNEREVIVSSIGFAAAGIINNWSRLKDNQKKKYMIALAKSYDRNVCLITNMVDLACINSKDFSIKTKSVDLGKMVTEKCSEYELIFDYNKDTKITCNIRKTIIASCNVYYIKRLIDNILSKILDNLHDVLVEITLEDYFIDEHQHARIEILFKSNQLAELENLTAMFTKIVKINLEKEYDIGNKLIEKIIEIHRGKISIKQQNYSSCIELMIPM